MRCSGRRRRWRWLVGLSVGWFMVRFHCCAADADGRVPAALGCSVSRV